MNIKLSSLTPRRPRQLQPRWMAMKSARHHSLREINASTSRWILRIWSLWMLREMEVERRRRCERAETGHASQENLADWAQLINASGRQLSTWTTELERHQTKAVTVRMTFRHHQKAIPGVAQWMINLGCQTRIQLQRSNQRTQQIRWYQQTNRTWGRPHVQISRFEHSYYLDLHTIRSG